jgi:hypothetical protein
MGCHQDNLPLAGVGYPESVTKGWIAVPAVGSRDLIVSNHPETVPAAITLPANLYWIWLTMPTSGSLAVRLFLWHGHMYPSGKRLWIVARLTGVDTNGEVTNHHRVYEIRHRDQIHLAGLCCAKALRNQTIDEDVDPVELEPDIDVKLYDVAQSYLVPGVDSDGIPSYAGAVHEFTIVAPAGAQVQLRTVISATEDTGNHSTNPISGTDTHPRGWWPYSDIIVQAASPIDLATSALPRVFMVCAALNNPDSNLFTKHSGDPHGYPASGNKGLYGVNASYEVPFLNDGTPRILNGYLRSGSNVPRDRKYFGSLIGDPCGIPPLQHGTANNAISIISNQLVAHNPIPVLVLPYTVAGAAATPFELFFTWTEQ